MIIDVTNSPKDWEDFWYNSKDIYVTQTNNEAKQIDDTKRIYKGTKERLE
tara:strand:- start:313 stop:462 length:150 start_codon:yes stop_codon:yes gene_type:complete